jgi:5-aminopentanamidase
LKLALYQGPSPQGDVAEALRRVETMLNAAACAGASLVVFPELFLPGYNQMNGHQAAAQAQGGLWEQELSRITKKTKCGLCIGWAERAEDTTFNAASCFDASGLKLAHYRKQHPYGPTEKSVFTAGKSDCIFDFNGKKSAMLICYDVEFAQRVRGLHEQGVELLLVPTANPIAFDVVSDTLVPARAFESRMTIAYANLCGTENGLTYGGKSVVVGPDGAILAKAGRGEALLIVDLNVVDTIDPSLLSTQLQD